MQAGHTARLGQEHRTELAGANQRDPNGPINFRAPSRFVTHTRAPRRRRASEGSVDFLRRGESLFQLGKGEVGIAADVKDRLFRATDKVYRSSEAGDAVGRDDDCALIVGVHDVAVRDPHPAHLDGLAEFDDVDMRVARADMSAKNLESFSQQVGVAVRAVGDATRRA